MDKSEAAMTGEEETDMDIDIDIEIMLLNEQIAEVRFDSAETQLKATLLVARAGMLQAAATRQLTKVLDLHLSHIGS